MESTTVCLNNKVAGQLDILSPKDYAFSYDPIYLADPTAIPLSLSLPLKAEPYTTKSLLPVLNNLWPEGIPSQGISDMGTVSLGNPLPSASPLFTALTMSEIRFSPNKPEVQTAFIGEEFYAPSLPLVSTHTLKKNSPSRQNRDLISNEIFVTLIAFNYGIPVPTLYRFNMASSPSDSSASSEENYTLIMDRPDRQAPPSPAELPVFHHCEPLRIAATTFQLDALKGRKGKSSPTDLSCDHIFSLLHQHSLRPALDFRTMIRALTVLLLTGCDDYDLSSTLVSLRNRGCRLLQFRHLISEMDLKKDTQEALGYRLLQNLFCTNEFELICDQHIITLAKKIGVNTKYLKAQLIEGGEILTKIALEILEDYPSLRNETTLMIQDSLQKRAYFLREKLK